MLALLLALSLSAAAEPTGMDARVTVEVQHAPLATFLDTVSARAKINFILTEGLEDEKLTTFLHDVTVAEALDVLKQTKKLDYRRLGKSDTFLVARAGSGVLDARAVIDGGPELDKKVTVRLKSATLAQFLDTLSAQTKVNFAVDESVADKKITAFLENVSVREALEVVLALKGLSCKRLKGREAYSVEGAGK